MDVLEGVAAVVVFLLAVGLAYLVSRRRPMSVRFKSGPDGLCAVRTTCARIGYLPRWVVDGGIAVRDAGRAGIEVEWRRDMSVRVSVKGRSADLAWNRDHWEVAFWSLTIESPPIYMTGSQYGYHGPNGYANHVTWPRLGPAIAEMVGVLEDPTQIVQSTGDRSVMTDLNPPYDPVEFDDLVGQLIGPPWIRGSVGTETTWADGVATRFLVCLGPDGESSRSARVPDDWAVDPIYAADGIVRFTLGEVTDDHDRPDADEASLVQEKTPDRLIAWRLTRRFTDGSVRAIVTVPAQTAGFPPRNS